MNTRTWQVVFGVVLLALLGWWFFPVPHCCGIADEDELRYESVLARATSGDVEAIRQLYAEESSSKHPDGARYWALMGALANDEALMQSYSALYKVIPEDVRKVDEVVIRKNRSTEGARRLAAMLNISLR